MEILRFAPGLIDEEMNRALEAEVYNDEIKYVLSSSKKGRSPSPCGIFVKF